MKKISLLCFFLFSTSIVFAIPKVYLFNEQVNFINSKKIEISGDMIFTGLLSRQDCLNKYHNPTPEANIYFEYTVDNGTFKTKFLDRVYPSYFKYQYYYSDNTHSNTYVHTVTSTQPNDYIYPVTDINRDSYILDEPYLNEECQFVEANDEGKIFHFHKIFNIYDIYPAPSSQYRIFIELEDNLITPDGSSYVRYFVRDFYGPFDVPSKYTSSPCEPCASLPLPFSP